MKATLSAPRSDDRGSTTDQLECRGQEPVGVVALRPGTKIHYDAGNTRVTNVAARTYRSGSSGRSRPAGN